MVMELYDSQYLLILAPSLVIALMFLFFWLFMKETSYDEVLARQKRDHRLPAAKPDARKKGEKKKSKKKEGGGGAGGGGGGDSEEDPRELDLPDLVASAPPEEEEPAVATPAPAPVEPPSGLRERKKKKEKQQQVVGSTRATPPVVPEEPVPVREVNGSKHMPHKSEPALAVSKQPSPPPAEPTGKKKGSQKRQKNEADDLQLEVRVEQAPPLVKKEAPVSVEVKVQENTAAVTNATPVISSTAPTSSTAGSGSSKKKTSAKKQKTEAVPALADEPPPPQPSGHSPLDNEPTAPTNPQKGHHEDTVPAKVNAKKLKNEANKENSEVKLKDFMGALRNLVLSEEEAVSMAAMLREKNPSALDAWYRSTAKADPSAQKLQERERLINTLQEEASIAKEKVKQLSQELQIEKQKMGRVETRLREQRSAMEEQQNVMQASYQMKIARLQQENNILRDAVSTGESKQSSELSQLRGECARLMKELSEANGKSQQEERQRKSLEVSYKQNVSQLEAQLQDAKRGWEELQGFLHSVNAEREKLQANKQELQNQLLAAESEMGSKNKEIQSLHSSLTDMMVSKEQLEQRLVQLLEVSQHAQHTQPDDTLQELLAENKSLQVQIENLQSQISAQAATALHFEELQKLLAEKELQRKSLEDSLNAERSSGASRETDMQALHTDNMTLKAEVQKLQAQMSEQTSSQLMLDQYQKSLLEKDEKIKTVEGLLESGLIQVANKEEELKMLRDESEVLRRDMEVLQQQKEQTPQESVLEELQRAAQEKDERMKMMEQKLQTELENVLSKETAMQALEQQVEALKAEMERARQRAVEGAESSTVRIQELRLLLGSRDEELQALQAALETGAKEAASKEHQIQALQEKHVALKNMLEEQQVRREEPSQELLAVLAEKDRHVAEMHRELEDMRATLELQRSKNNELRERNWSAMEALSATESMLQGKLSKTAQDSQKAVEVLEAECRDVLHRLLPLVPLPTNRNHKEWLCRFEAAAQEMTVTEPAPACASQELKVLEEKLKESEEAQKLLLKDCDTYKKVLAETEGILQRLQSSVEQEESRWRVKLEVSQNDLKEMSVKVLTLESELDRLNLECAELHNMSREKQQLEFELERAERESATYVTEVRELKDLLTELQSKLDGSYTEAVRQNEELTLLKTQLTQTLFKLETEESERQKVAGDLYKAQQSLDLIQAEILKEMGQVDLIENSTNATQMEDGDRGEKTAAGLKDTVRDLQQLLRAVNRKLTKDREADGEEEIPEV